MARPATRLRSFGSFPRCRPVLVTPSRGSASGALSLTKEMSTLLRSLPCRTLLPRWRRRPARQTSPTSSSQRGSRYVADRSACQFLRISRLPTRRRWRAYPVWSLKLPPSHGRLSCCRARLLPSQRQRAPHRLLRQCSSSARRLRASSWSGCMTGRPPNKPSEPPSAAAALAAQGQRRWLDQDA